MSKWYELSGKDSDIVLSSRVRLARNIDGYPFPTRLKHDQAIEVIEKIKAALQQEKFNVTDFAKLDAQHKASYVERHLASPDFTRGDTPRALLVSEDESVSVMVNEEDHIRLQVLGAGLSLNDCLSKAAKLDSLLDSKLTYAFDSEYGYLTACPTNIGTAMRFSVMLHLPALTETGNLRSLINSISKFGLTIRGLYGEGTSAQTSIYQLSNALALGQTENELMERLNDAALRIIKAERDLREKIEKRDNAAYADRVWRAYGILKHSRLISSAEAMNLLSDLRLATSSKTSEMPKIDPVVLNELLWRIQPNTMSVSINGGSRDAARSQLIRERI